MFLQCSCVIRVLQSGYECVLLIICGDYFTEDVCVMKEKSYLYTVKGAFGGSRKRLMNTGDTIHRKKRNDSYGQEELFEEEEKDPKPQEIQKGKQIELMDN